MPRSPTKWWIGGKGGTSGWRLKSRLGAPVQCTGRAKPAGAGWAGSPRRWAWRRAAASLLARRPADSGSNLPDAPQSTGRSRGRLGTNTTGDIIGAMEILFHHAARLEFNSLPESEKSAMRTAIARLEEFGDQLGARHTSAVQGSAGLPELRPRRGRSPWRAIYRRVGPIMVVGAFGPEAQVDRPGFDRTVRLAEQRIAEAARRRQEL